MSSTNSKIDKNIIHETFSNVIIYVYSIPDKSHAGRLKIGQTTTNISNPTNDQIYSTANDRINQQTRTADIAYTLEHAELAITSEKKNCFFDVDVHEVLINSGHYRKPVNVKNSHSEWFEISKDIAIKAIIAVKEGRKALNSQERINFKTLPIIFRPNQQDAISRTTSAIKKGRKQFLWNAKMRFGKTSAAMQVAKENKMRKVLIVTHRPSVSADWYSDFDKVLAIENYEYSSKTKGENIKKLLRSNKSFVYFASIQDLRLSKRVVEDSSSRSQASGFDKNDEVFDTNWDMMIVDEAHEGTQSDLGFTTLKKINTDFTLLLSGTPFNILHKHEEQDIYTWDYVMEQEEKLTWDERHPGLPNPYSELPALSILTYDIDTFENHIGKLGENFHDSLDGAFKFHEFFRVNKDADGNDLAEFVHKKMVSKFLDLLVNDNLKSKFPYATEEYRSYNKHSLWLLPNRVKIIEAMEILLNEHEVFGSDEFGIVNISGNKLYDDEDRDAKNLVTKAIKDNQYTITLTGQRLTIGASIPEWTAVFIMSDTNSATTYLQTAFRCQTPAKINGKIKTQGYVFDFAPDRTLKLVAEAIELNHKSGKTNSPEQKDAMRKFLNFCPILAASDGTMKLYDVEKMLSQLKKAIIERVRRNGFDDPKLYNDELLKLDDLDFKKFNDLKEIIGKSSTERVNEIEINHLGMNDILIEQVEDAERKKKKSELTEEEKENRKKLQEARKQKQTAISILRAVSIRMPMLVYGANINLEDDITLNKFIEIVDDESWKEFMPAGLSKDRFGEFTKYYDEDVFKGVARSIRAKAFDCDDLLPTERIQAIAEIFSTFKNPDKETVLTPWNVVNLHMTTAFGGHDFSTGIKDNKGNPKWKSHNVDTSIWSQEGTKILDINSKSGLYPLLATYNVYSRKLTKLKNINEKIYKQLWNQVLSDNIYVLCKSPMAKSITRRTLSGYSGAKTNIIYIDDLVKKIQQKNEYKDYNLRDELFGKFNLKDKNMKFTAVVGNPPYQETTNDNNRDSPIYHFFMEEAFKLSTKVCLISPARFLFNVGQTPISWNQKLLNDKHLTVIFFEQKSCKIFPNTDIKGGVVITYRDESQDFGVIGTFIPLQDLKTIFSKVVSLNFISLNEILFGRSSYKLSPKVYKDFPTLKGRSKPSEERSIGSNIFDKLPEVFLDIPKDNVTNYIKVVGRQENKRKIKLLNLDYISKHENLNKWKIFVAKSNGTGEFGENLSDIVIGEPYSIGTQTFVSFGAFDEKSEVDRLYKYIKTKFCRALLGIKKVTQDNATKEVWRYIPLQNFTNKSDIDWSKSISEIDKQLYTKYGLDKKEIDFIETRVKAMT